MRGWTGSVMGRELTAGRGPCRLSRRSASLGPHSDLATCSSSEVLLLGGGAPARAATAALAFPGGSLVRCTKMMRACLLHSRPKVIAMHLSLRNEHRSWSVDTFDEAECRAAAARFSAGLRELCHEIRAVGAEPVLGGVYGNNRFTAQHCSLLWEINEDIKSWAEKDAVLYFDYLGSGTVVTEDGHWPAGAWKDASHPNNDGHALMFQVAQTYVDRVAALASERSCVNASNGRYDFGSECFGKDARANKDGI